MRRGAQLDVSAFMVMRGINMVALARGLLPYAPP